MLRPSLLRQAPPSILGSPDKQQKPEVSAPPASKLTEKDHQQISFWRRASPDLNEKLKIALNDNLSLLVTDLLKKGAKFSTEQFHWALRIGANEDIIKELVKAGADVNAKDKDGNTALHFAAEKGALGVFITLLENNDSVNAINKVGMTPLLYAAYYGNKDGAELLLKAGADINAKSKGGLTVLHWLAYKDNQKNVDLLELLLKQDGGTDFIHVQNQDGATALDYATRNGRKELVEVLLQNGASNNIFENRLHYAIHKGHIELTEFLIKVFFENEKDINKREEKVNSQDEKGMTPLAYASKNLEKNKNLILTLIKNGADSTIGDKRGKSPDDRIAYGIYSRKNKEIITYFLKNGVAIHRTDWPPFIHLSCGESSRDLTNTLIKYETEEVFDHLESLWLSRKKFN